MNVSAALPLPVSIPAPPRPAYVAARTAAEPRPGQAEERALVERARALDEQAFRMLVERHRDAAYALALRITRSAPDAEDVAQEAFVRAWHALPGFRGDAAFGTWMHAIVARRAIDRAELLRRRRGREAVLDATPEPASATPAARDPLLARRLERLMDQLSAPQRAVVTLHYAHDRAVAEIAAELSMNENTVKTHLARARALLREAWLAEDRGGAS
jgi:RNA polymerase sigma-70 factor (ECF subfamily)